MERRIIGVCEVCGGPVEERQWPPDEFGPAETVWACDRCGWYCDLQMDGWEPPVLLFSALRRWAAQEAVSSGRGGGGSQDGADRAGIGRPAPAV